MNVTSANSPELVRVAREGTAQQYADTLKETGSAVLEHAIETFCATDRETEQGKEALGQLKDLKSSLMTYIERNEHETAANLQGANDKAARITAGTEPGIQLKPGSTQTFENQAPVYPTNNNSRASIPLGKRVTQQEKTLVTPVAVDPMQGVRQFLVDLNAVQGIYAASVMIPGPFSATVKSVAKEMMTSQMHSSSSSAGAGSSGGFGIGLLGLGATSGHSAFSSSSKSDGASQYEKTTVDERVVPVLMDLEDRLNQVAVTPATTGHITGQQFGEEFAGKKAWFSDNVNYSKESLTTTYYRQNQIGRELASFEHQPAHIRLPESGVSDFQAKKA